ncbi:hypothetical protein [Methanopyrus kandleri]
MTPIEAADGTVACVLGSDLVLWDGEPVPALRADDYVLAWPADGETLVLPLAGRTSLGYVAGSPLRVPGRPVRVIEGDPTVVLTDRTAIAVRDGRSGELVYRRDLSDGWFVAAFRFDDGFVVVLSDGRSVRESREYRSVTPTSEGLIVEDRDGVRHLLKPVRRDHDWELEELPAGGSSGSEVEGTRGETGESEGSSGRGSRHVLPAIPVPIGRRAVRWRRDDTG